MQRITVIGAGVIGLTTAIVLQESGYPVTILTKEMPPQTTSIAAGAIWFGLLDESQRSWAHRSLIHLQNLISHPKAGVHLLRMKDIYGQPVELPWFAPHIPYCEVLTDPYGLVMDIPIIQTPIYLAYLQERFQSAGGKIEQRSITTLSDLAEHPIIINCTGVGARDATPDDGVYPIRGQTVIVDAPSVTEGYHSDYMDDAFTYIFPRPDGIVLGGVAQENDWRLTVDEMVSASIITRCVALEPALRDAPIKGYTVGLRPGRATVRLEREDRNGQTIVHNYGHGGVGFTLSWGCAEDVLHLLQSSPKIE